MPEENNQNQPTRTKSQPLFFFPIELRIAAIGLFLMGLVTALFWSEAVVKSPEISWLLTAIGFFPGWSMAKLANGYEDKHPAPFWMRGPVIVSYFLLTTFALGACFSLSTFFILEGKEALEYWFTFSVQLYLGGVISRVCWVMTHTHKKEKAN